MCLFFKVSTLASIVMKRCQCIAMQGLCFHSHLEAEALRIVFLKSSRASSLLGTFIITVRAASSSACVFAFSSRSAFLLRSLSPAQLKTLYQPDVLPHWQWSHSYSAYLKLPAHQFFIFHSINAVSAFTSYFYEVSSLEAKKLKVLQLKPTSITGPVQN